MKPTPRRPVPRWLAEMDILAGAGFFLIGGLYLLVGFLLFLFL